MSVFKVTLNGVNRITGKLKKYEIAVSAEVREALTLGGFTVQSSSKKSIQSSPADPETGRSKPGNPPKTDTGRLVNSIFVDIEQTERGLSVRVGTNVKYGTYLEFGTRTVQARPWLGPALFRHKAAINKLVARAVLAARKALA